MTIFVNELLLTDVSTSWVDNVLWVECLSVNDIIRLVRWKWFVSLPMMVRTDWKTHVKFVISHWSVSISLIADLYHHQLTNRHYSFDSEDDFGSGCPNVSHQQQSFSELPSPYGIVNSHGIVEKTTMKTSIIFIYLPGSIDWCCTLLSCFVTNALISTILWLWICTVSCPCLYATAILTT